VTTVSVCAEPGCTERPAFRTRTRPTWCDDHITAILWASGLEPLEPFVKPSQQRLTRCLKCGCEAHYSFEYTLQRRNQSAGTELTCRACFWRQWAELSHRDLIPVSEAEARQGAEDNGFDYLEPLTSPSLENDPHRVQCRRCKRITAERLGDIGWGCTCRTNPSRAHQTANVSGAPGKKELFKDSELAAVDWWDHDANDAIAWATVTEKARKDVHWKCIYCAHRFAARIVDMATFPRCPNCESQRDAEYERYKTTLVAAVPELLAAWADEADPQTVTVAGGWELRRFRCPQGHQPRLSPYSYLSRGCPTCRGKLTVQERLDAIESAVSDSESSGQRGISPEIASQWHPTKNGKTRLEALSPRSQRIFWWREEGCGHEWQDSLKGRDSGPRLRCPECETILDSLAYHYPGIAAEWSPNNPISAWHVRPSGQTTFLPAWVCFVNPEHLWSASLASRSSGAGCPDCREHGKSKVELDHFAAAEQAFESARSGQSVRHEAFRRRPAWLVDITAQLPGGQKLAIEYDGSYWHAAKGDVDLAKTLDMLAAGYLVARLREHPLEPLPLSDDRYVEFPVYSTAPDPKATIARVKEWATDKSSPPDITKR